MQTGEASCYGSRDRNDNIAQCKIKWIDIKPV